MLHFPNSKQSAVQGEKFYPFVPDPSGPLPLGRGRVVGEEIPVSPGIRVHVFPVPELSGTREIQRFFN